ncbi:MAG TPA: ABC transporter substrate-binding protein [Acidimicrobiales bacterium]|nr:ABC transporter substrate-binding protein [Acidimicrobiales bacterium]
MRTRIDGKIRLASVGVMVTVAMTLAVSGLVAGSAGAAGGNILPKVGNSTPTTGGTLTMVGSGDVDKLDTCCAYYTTTYELLRMVSRQLVSYKASYANGAAGTPVPDIATYSISPNGLTYTFHIKQGVMWDTPTGPRQVTSQDEVRGIKRLCNPISPAPPLPYWTNNIAGMSTYCAAFAKITVPTAPADQVTALNAFYAANNISGLATPSASTLTITLGHPSSSFLNILAMPMSSPVPVETNNYVPGSVTEETNFISDGPYTITSYTPNVSYTLVKNPAWSQSTDTIRHQYFNGVSVTMGESATSIQQQLQTGAADMEWDTTVPTASVPGLVATKSPDFAADFFGGLTYLVFNTKSTANGGALQKTSVRQALQYCVNKQHIVHVTGGPAINEVSNQILPPAMNVGYKQINPYPTPNNAGNPSKCKSMLAKAGYKHGITLTLVYANNPPMPAQAVALQSDFAKGAVTIKLNEQPTQGAYFNYIETPSNKANWDLAFGEWFPDWVGNGAQTYFSPLLDGRQYATGSTDYGDYNNTTVDKYIDAALTTGSLTKAAADWAAADNYVMTKDPAWIPLLNQALPQFIGSNVEHPIYLPFIGGFDPTNLWVK